MIVGKYKKETKQSIGKIKLIVCLFSFHKVEKKYSNKYETRDASLIVKMESSVVLEDVRNEHNEKKKLSNA